jgi:hypothetical protein
VDVIARLALVVVMLTFGIAAPAAAKSVDISTPLVVFSAADEAAYSKAYALEAIDYNVTSCEIVKRRARCRAYLDTAAGVDGQPDVTVLVRSYFTVRVYLGERGVTARAAGDDRWVRVTKQQIADDEGSGGRRAGL